MSTVSFANEVDEAVATNVSPLKSLENDGLSKSARVWDIDGDGKLDEAELALKNMDSNKSGTISKDDMYRLMTSNLKTQHELTQMKKVVFGLIAITCILAIANLGTSFAAAILSKDTMTQQGVLVDKDSNKAVRTDTYANIFHEDKAKTEARHRQRRLECETSETGVGLSCTFHDHVVSATHALEMLSLCRRGSDVDIEFTHDSILEHFCICPPNSGKALYTVDASNVTISAEIESNGKTFVIAPENEGDDDYLVTWDEE